MKERNIGGNKNKFYNKIRDLYKIKKLEGS